MLVRVRGRWDRAQLVLVMQRGQGVRGEGVRRRSGNLRAAGGSVPARGTVHGVRV